MSRHIASFGPNEIEIEKFASDAIIHLFPSSDPHDAVEDILKGLYLLDKLSSQADEVDEIMKQKEQANYLIMAFAEVKRINKKSLEEAEDYAFKVLEKMKFRAPKTNV